MVEKLQLCLSISYQYVKNKIKFDILGASRIICVAHLAASPVEILRW